MRCVLLRFDFFFALLSLSTSAAAAELMEIDKRKPEKKLAG
jgi:hypothetical protein